MSGMTQWSRGRGALLSALVALSALALAGCVGDDASPRNGGQDLSQLLAAEAATAFAPVTRPARLEFPRDHGPHPAHRIEWWYYTANLRGPGDEAFGVQVALFRFALRSGTEATGWEAGQLYMAHVAISELDGGRFHVDERLARPAAGLAGAQSEPFAAWVETCSARGLSAGGMFPLRLSCPGRNADGEAFGLELELVADKPRVLHGEDGYSEKSDVPGGASYYYAYTRLAARGELQLPGRDAPVPVSGSAWYDHEWGSIGLGDEQAGWDWFSLQLDDGHELMFFHIRDRDGRPVSQRGSLVAPDGACGRSPRAWSMRGRCAPGAARTAGHSTRWRGGCNRTPWTFRWKCTREWTTRRCAPRCSTGKAASAPRGITAVGPWREKASWS